MIRRPPRSTLDRSSAASDVYKRQNEVSTLVNDTKSAGKYDVRFDASGLSNGVYFYTVKADNFTSTKKMILIK